MVQYGRRFCGRCGALREGEDYTSAIIEAGQPTVQRHHDVCTHCLMLSKSQSLGGVPMRRTIGGIHTWVAEKLGHLDLVCYGASGGDWSITVKGPPDVDWVNLAPPHRRLHCVSPPSGGETTEVTYRDIPSPASRVVGPDGNKLQPPREGVWMWQVTLRHPIADKPMSEQISDEEVDSYAAALAPGGWVLGDKCVQGRDRRGRRVVYAVYHRTSGGKPTLPTWVHARSAT